MSRYSIEDIARFAEGDMDEQESRQFSSELQADAELQEQLAHYNKVQSSLKMKFMEDKSDKAFQSSLKNINDAYFKKETKIVPFRKYIVWSSAVAAVFILFLIWSPWNENLYQKYSATEMTAIAERGENTSEDQMQKAVEAFNKKEFKQAEVLLQQIVKSSPDNSAAQYYYAISSLENGKTEQARNLFMKLYQGESVLKYDAAFYMALSYLKEKNEKECLVWLEKIPEGAATYEKAKELSEKLR